MYVSSNTFNANQGGVVFYEEHELPRASLIQAVGLAQYQIFGNEFLHYGTMYQTAAESELPRYVAYLPDNYFKH